MEGGKEGCGAQLTVSKVSRQWYCSPVRGLICDSAPRPNRQTRQTPLLSLYNRPGNQGEFVVRASGLAYAKRLETSPLAAGEGVRRGRTSTPLETAAKLLLKRLAQVGGEAGLVDTIHIAVVHPEDWLRRKAARQP